MGSSLQDLAGALWLSLRQIHQWQAQKLGISNERVIRASSWVWRGNYYFYVADFFQWSNRKRYSGGRRTLKEEVKNFFRRKSCLQVVLDWMLGRVVGLFGFIYKVCYFLFNVVVYLFVDGELRLKPSSMAASEVAQTTLSKANHFLRTPPWRGGHPATPTSCLPQTPP